MIGLAARQWGIATDPDFRREAAVMEFRLTYEGHLMGSKDTKPRPDHKHSIRRVFHTQLKRLWETNPTLSNWLAFEDVEADVNIDFSDFSQPIDKMISKAVQEIRPRSVELAEQYARCGYRFVPLVIPSLRLLCGISVLFLRPEFPGGLVRSADLDARLKTLFDALRMPQNKGELGGHDVPGEGEDPFYVLTSDDSLITNISIETDVLLQPLPGKQIIDKHDARLVITVTITPYSRMVTTLGF